MPHTTAGPAPIAVPAPILEARAHQAERLRTQLADFWGKPLRGIPCGMDLLRTMFITVTAQDLTHDAALHYLALCDNNAAAYRTSDVWVAPHSMGQRITEHPFLTTDSITVGNLEDIARARDGLVYFPTPIHLDGLHPLSGLAWHMEGTGDDLTVDFETITDTRLIPTSLPPLLAATTKLPLSPYCPNGLATLHGDVLNGYSNPDLFGAPGPATILALLLAFWDLCRPTDAPDDPDSPEAVDAADEDIVNVPQHTNTGTKNTGRNRKNKNNRRPARKRPIRIIRESAHTPTAATGQPRPTDGTADASGSNWKDDTLRWEVSQKYQNRCPNPHQHRAIIEAGGECKPVRVPVKAHVNGPRGRDVDPRRTVRIVPDRHTGTRP
ncbi:hypothetical protein OG883_45550 [Streptomyces sp. NBC_01142]|uniref:hypothetical protein n=1 Tax=Streptomyces sp. NBC_01142 TaxID=2975865 RepID=UPI002251B3BD|nr:hypothetical protein [Streptomyces sp. NBC_01142]MCX4826906.1 hypothetical protein [Streptomyces sp. NBC_01142]